MVGARGTATAGFGTTPKRREVRAPSATPKPLHGAGTARAGTGASANGNTAVTRRGSTPPLATRASTQKIAEQLGRAVAEQFTRGAGARIARADAIHLGTQMTHQQMAHDRKSLIGASGAGHVGFGANLSARLPVTGVGAAGINAGIDKNSTQSAAAIKILAQTSRPVHGIAGAADALVQGKGLSAAHHALTRGLENKDQVLFSSVLKHLGAPKSVQSIGGFALDVGLDPTTYVSFGTASVAKRAAVQAGERVALKAAKAGMSPARAAQLAKVATERAVKTEAPKGLAMRLAGHEVPGVTHATAVAGRGVKIAAAKAPRTARKAGSVAKESVREVRPTMTPAGADAAQFARARQVAREARAATNAGAAVADREARGLAKRIADLQKQHGPTVSADIIDAIERRRIGSLPADLRAQAIEIRDHYKYMKRLRARAGVREGTIQNYFPHARQDALHARMGVVEDSATAVPMSSAKRTGPTPEGSARRTDKRPLNEASAARVAKGEAPFSTDIPLVTSNYATSTARTVAENKAFMQLAEIGRKYKPGDTLAAGEKVYHVGYAGKNSKFGLRAVADGEAKRAGKYVVLDEKTVEAVQKRIKPAQATTQAGRAFDRATGGFKRVATFTPGFHIRNAIGDTQMAYLSQPGHTLPRNLAQAMKANRANVRLEKMQAKHLGAMVPDTGKTIKVAGKRMPVEQFVALAQKLGVTQSGQISRELVDLAQGAAGHTHVAGKVGRVARKALGPAERATRGRENVIRLTTFKHGLDKGMSPRDAADLSLKTHIDYGDLTDLERRALRRALPFYTFSARAIPFHAEKLLTHPGKFAAYEKLIEEGAKAAGLGPDWQNNVDQFKQRQIGVPLKVGGRVVLVSASLPMTTLNELPTGLSPGKYADEAMQFFMGMLNPVIKDPVEMWANYSFFFRSPIRNPDKPLVAAPRWVAVLPGSAKGKLGVTTIIDPKTGNRVPAWDAKANYVSKIIPGPVALVQSLLTPGTSRRGQGTGAKVVGALGVKVDDYDPAKVALDNAYTMVSDISAKLGKMRQQGRSVGKDGYYTAEYAALLKQRGQVVKARDVLAAQGAGAKVAAGRGKARPLTIEEKIRKEVADYKKKADPVAARQAILDEVKKYKAAAGAP